MAHHHGRPHLVRRQRAPVQVEEIETVVMTMPNTFTGEVVWKTLDQPPPPQKTRVAPPVQATQPAREPDDEPEEEPEEEPEQTLVAPTTRNSPASTTREEESDAEETETARATSTAPRPSSARPTITSASDTSQAASSRVAASTALSGLAAATISSSPSAVPSAEAGAAASSGMSGGAKAGLALGILFAIGALLGAILFVYHRKKKQAAQHNDEDEKFAMQNAAPPPPPQAGHASSITSSAPRLSLRPVTQFDPMFPKRKSGANLLTVATTGPVARTGDRSPSPVTPTSPWERRGAANAANTPTNPFNDPQSRSVSPLQDPFSNNAAIETRQASAPATPTVVQHAPAPESNFANPAPAIAAAETAAVIAALPSPPSIQAGNTPPSPAWTEDIPASPGPAPSGPLPVAVAVAPNQGAAPPPNNVHRVQLDFKPSMADELGLNAGQLVRMLHEYDDGWALCVRMDRSQQGVVPRTCLSKHPVKPRTGPPRQGPPGPRMRGPPVNPPKASGAVPQPRPLSPASGRQSPHPASLSPAAGRMSPAPRSMSPGPRQMPPPQVRGRANSNAPYAGPPRSMSPGPYGGGPSPAKSPQTGRPRSKSSGQAAAQRPVPSPMNPNVSVPRKPLPGQAL